MMMAWTTVPLREAADRPAGDRVELVLQRFDGGCGTAADFALLSAPERRRASRLRHGGDRRRFAAGRAQLRRLLGARLGVAPAGVELAVGEYGKPVLAGRFAGSPLRFSVAHAGDVAAYAFARGREVGVDIEALGSIDGTAEVVCHFFSERERAAYRALGAGDRPLGFFNAWTRKEALAKALGQGLRQPLDAMEVSLAPDEPARILRCGARAGADCGWTLTAFTAGPGMVGALVVQRRAGEAAALARRSD